MLNKWSLPLLRLDVGPKFVQLIKLVQSETGTGGPAVRPPRLEPAASEREEALRTIRERLAGRPAVQAMRQQAGNGHASIRSPQV